MAKVDLKYDFPFILCFNDRAEDKVIGLPGPANYTFLGVQSKQSIMRNFHTVHHKLNTQFIKVNACV